MLPLQPVTQEQVYMHMTNAITHLPASPAKRMTHSQSANQAVVVGTREVLLVQSSLV